MAEFADILIRRAELGDADRLADFASRTFHATFARDNRPEDMAHYLNQAFGPTQQLSEIVAREVTTLIAESAGLAAFAQLRLSPAPASVTSASPIELWRFYVDQSWHGRGVAQRLMQAVCAEAITLGAGSIWLGVWERNARAAAFYRKCGFIEVGECEFRLGQDVQTDRIMLLPKLALPQGQARPTPDHH